MAFSIQTRANNLKRLQTEVFDLVIVGGGICGVGAARDAASRGMKVALVEAQDFAAGTSSRSSKLIHGGIRYLENFEFGLVFEALSERRHLFSIAPHLVHPLRFMLPVYDDSRVGMFKLGLGMWAYDALSLFEAPELHERYSKSETLDHMSILDPSGLVGSYVYSDAYMDDDRLVIETLRSAVQQGAVAANYLRATSAHFTNGKVDSIVVKDVLSNQDITLRGRHFMSTVGPWTDLVASDLLKEWQPIMRPSKGVHLTFNRSRLPLKDAVVMVSNDQKRIIFAIPRHEMVIVGTTDTDFKGDPKNVHTTREDVDYLLRVTNEYFPGANLQEVDIIASYSGVRPLVDDGSETESKTSREHLIFNDPRNITFVTGGKYTTYRLIAEQAVEAAIETYAIEDRVKFRNTSNRTLEPLNEMASIEAIKRARLDANIWAQDFKVDVDTVNFLVERHGLEAYDILDRYSFKATDRWQFEAYHAIYETMCFKLVDFYLRRVPLFLAHEDHGFSKLAELSDLFQKELGWSEIEKQNEIRDLQNHMKHEMSWAQKQS